MPTLSRGVEARLQAARAVGQEETCCLYLGADNRGGLAQVNCRAWRSPASAAYRPEDGPLCCICVYLRGLSWNSNTPSSTRWWPQAVGGSGAAQPLCFPAPACRSFVSQCAHLQDRKKCHRAGHPWGPVLMVPAPRSSTKRGRCVAGVAVPTQGLSRQLLV